MKCDICKQEYTVYDPKKPNLDKDKKLFRYPDEWNEKEVIAHRLSHVSSPRVRRILGKFIKLLKIEKAEFLDFIDV